MEILRKHRTQMSEREIEYAEFAAHSTDGWQFPSSYVAGRMQERNIDRDAVIATLMAGSVIEMKSNGRIVMRSDAGICAVADLRTKAVVTVWRNAVTDSHSTLDLREYTWDVALDSVIKRLL